MDLKSSLETLDKSELVSALVELAKQRGDAYAYCAGLVSHKKAATASSAEINAIALNDIALKGMQKDLRSKLARTAQNAEECCGGKYHFYDDSHCVHDVRAVHKEWILSKRISMPEIRLQALCELAKALMPNLYGKIYDFEGDRVLLELDNSVVETLNEARSVLSTISEEVLEQVAEVFDEDYHNWVSSQAYGLFEDAPSKLEGGACARKLGNLTSNGSPIKKGKKRKIVRR